jgi:hypothetical protein
VVKVAVWDEEAEVDWSNELSLTVPTKALPSWADSITAVYNGDLNFAGNTSSALIPAPVHDPLPDGPLLEPS